MFFKRFLDKLVQISNGATKINNITSNYYVKLSVIRGVLSPVEFLYFGFLDFVLFAI